MRDNPLAIAEGDASAPRVQTKAISSAYFLATRTTDYNVSTPAGSTWKMAFNTEVYDPDSLYDNTTFRFTPNKAGLYLVTVHVYCTAIFSGSSDPNPDVVGYIYKNGALFLGAHGGLSAGVDGQYSAATVTALVQMNGTSDYLEGFVGDGVSGGFATSNSFRGHFHAVGLCEA